MDENSATGSVIVGGCGPANVLQDFNVRKPIQPSDGEYLYIKLGAKPSRRDKIIPL